MQKKKSNEMKKLFYYLILIGLLTSCKTKQPVIIYRDSIRVHTLHDSIYLQRYDSIYIHQKGDTVRIEKYKTTYKDKFKTITDTLIVNKEKQILVEVPVYKKYIPKWCWYCLAFIIGFVLISLAKFFIWGIKKYPKLFGN